MRRVLFLLMLAVCARAADLIVRVDPRIELLAVVQSLAGYERFGLINRLAQPYRQDVRQWFEPHRAHPAVRLFDAMSAAGFAYDAPPSILVCLSAPPALEVQAQLPQADVDRAGGRVQLDAWLEALRDFARVTRFTDFFTAHRRTYRALERQVITELANTDITGAFERYYGARPRSYHVVLSPLLHPGGFGARVNSPAGLEIYSILGPQRGLDGGLADFGAGATLRRLLWHEFGHSFANPLVDRHAGRVRRAGALYAPVSAEMRRQAYGNWMVTVREHVVRAMVVRLVTLHAGEREGRRVLDEELSSGFAYIGALCRRLEEYDRNRDRYPTFDVFFPRLLRVFDKAAARYTSLIENAGHRVLIRAAPAAVRLGLFSRLRAGRFRLEKETGGEMVFCSEQEPRRVVTFRFDLCPSGLLVTPSSRARELRTLLVDLKLASERPGL